MTAPAPRAPVPLSSLERLPPELLDRILAECPGEDIASVAQASRFLRSFVAGDRVLQGRVAPYHAARRGLAGAFNGLDPSTAGFGPRFGSMSADHVIASLNGAPLVAFADRLVAAMETLAMSPDQSRFAGRAIGILLGGGALETARVDRLVQAIGKPAEPRQGARRAIRTETMVWALRYVTAQDDGATEARAPLYAPLLNELRRPARAALRFARADPVAHRYDRRAIGAQVLIDSMRLPGTVRASLLALCRPTARDADAARAMLAAQSV